MTSAAQIRIWLGSLGLLITTGSVIAGHHGVSWPAMSDAEEQMSLVRMLAASGNPDGYRERMPILAGALETLGNSAPPDSVKDPFSVRLLQQDLLKQSAALGNDENVSPGRLLDQLHQLFEELAEATGELIPPHGPNDGVVTALKSPDGDIVCYAEVVLRDGEGALECRLFADHRGNEPFDIPISSSLTALFLQPEQRAAVLQVRKASIVEDEKDGRHVRGKRTNYFVYPGDSGADEKWLAGPDFTGWMSISFSDGGTAQSSDVFRVIPAARIRYTPHTCKHHNHE